MRRPNLLGLHPDELLVALSIGGATRAFEELVKRHNGPLRRFLLRLTRHYGDAEELSQEAFIRAWQNLAKWQNNSSFRSWLFSIGHNCFLDDLRKSKSRAARDKSWLELQEVTNIGESDQDLRQELERILRHFGPQQGAVLELFYGDGFSHSEISDIMDMPIGSVKSVINRARVQIAVMLRGEITEERLSNG